MSKMKRIFWYILFLFGIALAGWYWTTRPVSTTPPILPAVSQTEKALPVTVSGYVVYTLAKEIGGDKIQLTMLVPPGTEPHDFDPTPGTIIAIDTSDLFLYISPGIDPWVEDILRGLGKTQAYAVGAVADGENPHSWMTPAGAVQIAQHIAQVLAQVDSKNTSYYQENLARFKQEMTQLDQHFKQGLSNCQNRTVLHIGHNAFLPLAQAYGLTMQVLTGTSRQGEHSAYKLAALVQTIRREQLSAIFTEEMLSQQLVQTLADETGVQILPLYTIEEVSKQDFDRGISYQDYMQRNLQHLQEGLKCQP